MPTRIVIAGIGGRMGREIASAAVADPALAVVGGTVRQGKAAADLASVAGVAIPGGRLVDDLAQILADADVLVDFTTPAATLANARAAADAGRPAVIGTTGLTPDQLAELARIGERIPLLYARNTSVGVNALLRIVPMLARALAGYDIEITEAHHRHKQDAPSGTALALGEAIAAALGTSLDRVAVHGRSGISPRAAGEIGIHALRGGGNAGEHTILFADEGEQIQVVHRAYSRRTFALGALRAAAWLPGQPPGFYGMADMLGG